MESRRAEYFATLVEHETSLWNALDRQLKQTPGSVTLGRFSVLQVIGSGEGRVRVQDVAHEIGITVGAASRLADRLEADDLIRRSPNPADRRGSVLELTEAGVSRTEATRLAFDEALGKLLGDVADQELVELTARLRRVADILRATMEEDTDA